jgi:hypothetical protein
LLKHEERRAYQNKYNVVGIAIYTLFRDLLASGFTQHEESDIPKRMELLVD